MANKYTGDAVIGVGLSVQAPKPLDDRTVVANLQQLYATNARYAYEGMTVANLDNGNIYMLTDKSKITSKAGWKASYESIQILTCTEEEYKSWLENTNADFTPKDESKTYIHQDTYYYIWEESLSAATEMDEYLKASWGKQIEDLISTKASSTALVTTNNSITALLNLLTESYATLLHVADNYVPLSFIEGADDGGLTALLGDYYTKDEVDNTFVTKESLKGGLDDDDYVFVTATLYATDLEALATYKESIETYKASVAAELATTLKTSGDGALESITVGKLKSPAVEGETLLEVDVTKNGLFINNDKLATLTDLPKLITLTKEEYEALETIDDDAYYYVTNESEAYVKQSDLAEYSTTTAYQSWSTSKYYDKTTIDLKLGAIQTGSATALEGYYTKSEVDASFTTNTALTTTLADYVTKEMLGGAEGEEGDYIFVTNTTYLAAMESLLTSIAESISALVATDSDASLKSLEVTEGVSAESVSTETVTATTSITTPKIINGTDTAELKEGGLQINSKKVALQEDLTPTIVMSRAEYDAMDPEDRDPNAYYYLYNTDDDLALVTALELQNYYTKALVDSKLAALKNELTALIAAQSGTIPAEAQTLLNELNS